MEIELNLAWDETQCEWLTVLMLASKDYQATDPSMLGAMRSEIRGDYHLYFSTTKELNILVRRCHATTLRCQIPTCTHRLEHPNLNTPT
jgi:hypothetical protein